MSCTPWSTLELFQWVKLLMPFNYSQIFKSSLGNRASESTWWVHRRYTPLGSISVYPNGEIVVIPPYSKDIRIIKYGSILCIHCNLIHLPDSLGKLINLDKLYINHCGLIKLPESIGKLHNLTQLFISHCPLQQLPTNIGQLLNLNKLDLIHCKLKELPNSIGQLANLAELKIVFSVLFQQYRCL